MWQHCWTVLNGPEQVQGKVDVQKENFRTCLRKRGGGKSSADVFRRNGPFTGVALGHRPHTSAGSNSSLTKSFSTSIIPEHLLFPVGRDSSVGIATSYGMDGPGIESRWGARFSSLVQTCPRAYPASCMMGAGSLSWG